MTDPANSVAVAVIWAPSRISFFISLAVREFRCIGCVVFQINKLARMKFFHFSSREQKSLSLFSKKVLIAGYFLNISFEGYDGCGGQECAQHYSFYPEG